MGLLARDGVSREDAQDLVHEALVRVLQFPALVRDIPAFVLVTARNLWLDEIRKRRVRERTRTTVEALYGERCESRDAFRLCSSEESVQDLLASLEKMPSRRREAWCAVRVLGEPFKAVAERYGVSVKAIEKTLQFADLQLTAARDYCEWACQGSDMYLSVDGSCRLQGATAECD